MVWNQWRATHYRPKAIKPKVRILKLTADTEYTNFDTIAPIPRGTRITIHYEAIDSRTLVEKQQYQIKLSTSASLRMSEITKTLHFDWIPKKADTYTFSVQAIDRDLDYSEPKQITVTVVVPWYQNGWILYASAGGIFALLLFSTVLGYRNYQQRQQVQAYQRLAVEEIADARQVQMGLIPETTPQIEGLEIAGKCISANTVSGDFFDYIFFPSDMLAIVLADVTGKGMKAAMNAVLSSGALHSEAKLGRSPAEMLRALNRNLCSRFQPNTNCAMAIVIIDGRDKTLRYANAGIPYPIVKRSGTIEVPESNGPPLGAWLDAEYEDIETDRMTSLIEGFDKDMTAGAAIEALIADVQDFSGDIKQNDDMTVVVVKVL